LNKIDLKLLDSDNVEQILDKLFEQHQIPDVVLSQSVRSLMNARKYRQAVNLIYAAIRNDQARPWVYGVLTLALEADHAPPKELERAMLSAASSMTSPDERLLLAFTLERAGLDQRALQMYCEVCKMIPHIAEPYRFAIRLAQNLNDEKALKELTLGMASQSWNGKEMQELWQRGATIANGLITRMKNTNRNQEAGEYEAALREALRCDCIVFFEYAGDAEVDIAVKEPADTICWFGNPQTPSGGVLGRNWLSAASKSDSKSGTKSGLKSGSYTCPFGFSGTYEVLVERIWGNVVPGNRVSVTVYTNYGTDHVSKQTKTVSLDDNGMALIRFQLSGGRRTESLDDVKLTALSDEAKRVRVASQLAKGKTELAKQTSEKNIYKPHVLMVPSGAEVESLDKLTTSSPQTPNRKFIRISPAANFKLVKKVVEFEMRE